MYFLALIRLIKDGITPCDLNPSVRLSNICCAFFHATPCSPLRLHMQRAYAARHLHIFHCNSTLTSTPACAAFSMLQGTSFFIATLRSPLLLHVQRVCAARHLHGSSWRGRSRGHCASVLHGRLLPHRCALTHIKIHRKADHIERKGIR